MNEKKKLIRFFIIIAALTFILLFLFALQRLLMPKYSGEIREGALIDDFYAEQQHDIDVLILGDCEAYENISTVTLWEEFGINSFIRGSARQTMWQSYYLLEDTLRFAAPQVVVLNVLPLIYNEPQSEAYNRMTLDGMQWSPAKIGAIFASMTEEETFISYVFPILRYHDRWSELTDEDVAYIWKKPVVSYNGYLMNTGIKPAENVPTGRVLGDYTFGSVAMAYIDRIRQLCEEKGIRLLLMKAPSLYPYWYNEYEEQVCAYAQTYNLQYINYLELQEETRIDYLTDTYDAGLHLNVYGAEKLARSLGTVLKNDYGVPDRRTEADLSERWDLKVKQYKEERKQ